jgi:hypothetical protein
VLLGQGLTFLVSWSKREGSLQTFGYGYCRASEFSISQAP